MPSHWFLGRTMSLWLCCEEMWTHGIWLLKNTSRSETSDWTEHSTQHLSVSHSRIIFFQAIRKRRCKVGWLALTMSVWSGIYFTHWTVFPSDVFFKPTLLTTGCATLGNPAQKWSHHLHFTEKVSKWFSWPLLVEYNTVFWNFTARLQHWYLRLKRSQCFYTAIRF